MTRTEVVKFRKILEANVIELDRSVRRRDDIAVEPGGDALDLVLRAEERELALRDLEAGSIKLRATRAALRRIDEGKFGRCSECNGEISSRRLAAVPCASLCIACQEELDRTRKAGTVRPVFPMAA